MPERPKCHTGMTDVRVVAEHDFEYGNVADDWGRDGGDEEEDSGDEEEGYTDPGARSAVECN